MDEKFCYAPWYSLHLHPSGVIKPCCIYKGQVGDRRQGDRLEDAWTSPEMKEVRRAFLSGKPPQGCRKCYEKEAQGIRSMRQRVSEMLPTEFKHRPFSTQPESLDLYFFDLSFSNLCNLRCRFCNPDSSTLWIKDVKRPEYQESGFWSYLNEQAQLVPFEAKASEMLEFVLKSPSLRRIEIKGGEPFLSSEHLRFVKKLSQTEKAHELTLAYTTNGTQLKPAYLKPLEAFERVDVSVSIEAVGKLYQYIRGGRYGFEQAEKALSFFSQLENSHLYIQFTLCALNVFAVKDFWTWFEAIESRINIDKVNLGLVVEPSYLNTAVLPQGLLKRALTDLPRVDHPFIKKVREHLLQAFERSGQDLNQERLSFQKFVRLSDQRLKLHLSDIEPAFKEMV